MPEYSEVYVKSKVLLLAPILFLIFIAVSGCGQVIKQQSDNTASLLPSSMSISPNGMSIPIGSSQQFYISNLDMNKIESSADLLWEVIGDVGNINSSGLFTATKTGTGQIKATYGNMIAQAQVTVASIPNTSPPTTSPSPPPSAPLVPPAIPTGLTAGAGDSVVYLHWNANSENDLVGYLIYRRQYPNNDYTEIATVKNGTNYEDRDVVNGTEYIYKIRAYNTSGECSDYTLNVATARPMAASSTLPPIPRNVSATLAGDEVRITWDPCLGTNIEGYNVYRRRNSELIYTKMNSIVLTSTTYIDRDLVNENSYHYVVTSLDASRNESPYSSEVGVIYYHDVTSPVVNATTNLRKFSPNGDGFYDGIEFDARSDESATMHFEILGAHGGILYQGTMEAAANELIKLMWINNEYRQYRRDGMGLWNIESVTAAAVAADGSYAFRAYAVDRAGNISTNVDCIVERDTTPPNISNINDAPDYFSPDGDGLDETSIISCDLSEVAYMNVKIYDSENSLFRTLGGISGANSYSCGWDGRSSAGSYKPDYHTFTYEIIAQDFVGNRVQSPKNEISTNRCSSRISYAFGTPDPFNPRGGGYTDIRYFVSYNSNVTVTIDGVKVLLSNVSQARGEYNIRWYGDYDSSYAGSKDAVDNSKVGSGSYLFRINAYDPRGGSPANVTNTIRVDNR